MKPLSTELFLFRPSKRWAYCGGGVIICAPTLDRAIEIANVASREDEIAEGGQFVTAEDVLGEPDYARGVWFWVFVESFTLAAPRECGVVFTDANYA